MKKVWMFLLLGVLVSNQSVFAKALPSVSLSGSLVAFEAQPIVQDGRVWIPVQIAHHIGMDVNWDSEQKEIVFNNERKRYRLKIGDKKGLLDGNVVTLLDPIKKIDDQNYISLRAFGDLFHKPISYDQVRNIIFLNEVDKSTIRETVHGDNLLIARSLMIGLPWIYDGDAQPITLCKQDELVKTNKSGQKETAKKSEEGYSYRFPEGKADRYIYSNGDIDTYVVMDERGYVKVKWQLRHCTDGKNTAEEGKRPQEKDFVFFLKKGKSNQVQYGKKDTGETYNEYMDEPMNIIQTIPNERPSQ